MGTQAVVLINGTITFTAVINFYFPPLNVSPDLPGFAGWIFGLEVSRAVARARCARASRGDNGSVRSLTRHIRARRVEILRACPRSFHFCPSLCVQRCLCFKAGTSQVWHSRRKVKVFYAKRSFKSIPAVHFLYINIVLIYAHVNAMSLGFTGMLICLPTEMKKTKRRTPLLRQLSLFLNI